MVLRLAAARFDTPKSGCLLGDADPSSPTRTASELCSRSLSEVQTCTYAGILHPRSTEPALHGNSRPGSPGPSRVTLLIQVKNEHARRYAAAGREAPAGTPPPAWARPRGTPRATATPAPRPGPLDHQRRPAASQPPKGVGYALTGHGPPVALQLSRPARGNHSGVEAHTRSRWKRPREGPLRRSTYSWSCLTRFASMRYPIVIWARGVKPVQPESVARPPPRPLSQKTRSGNESVPAYGAFAYVHVSTLSES
jgi:hypothetical protein